MEQDSSLLGALVQDRRIALGLGLRDLARLSGVNPGSLSRIEAGQKTPEPDTLSSLASALQVPLADLYAAAGYPLPGQLPSLRLYLRRAYNVPDHAVDAIENYMRNLSRDPFSTGPKPGEDEEPM